jgi:predicted PurR-regulated permease PerM
MDENSSNMKTRLLQINQGLLLMVLLALVLYYGRLILIPLTGGILLAMLMTPLSNRLENHGHNRNVSCIVSILILLVVFVGMFLLVMAQLTGFVQDLPLFQEKLNLLVASLQQQIEKVFSIPAAEQTAVIRQETEQLNQTFRNSAAQVLQSSLRLLVGIVITLFFTFLMLYHREKYHRFFLQLTPGQSEAEKKEILLSASNVAQQYLRGRAISIAFFFFFYLATLMIFGVKGALLLSAVAALVNIIPYLGPVLAAVLPTVSTLVTEPHWQTGIWVLICFCLIQAVDNYYVTPFYLGAEVNLTALATFVAIIVGGMLWGIIGMIIFVPIVSIAKIFFDRIPSMKQVGALIGDEGEKPSQQLAAWLRNFFSKWTTVAKQK